MKGLPVFRTLSTCLAVALLAPLSARGEDVKAPPKWYDTFEIHGLVDTAFSANFDQVQGDPNELRVFDALNGFQLSYTKVWAQLTPTGPFTGGLRVDLGMGQTAAILNLSGVYGVGNNTDGTRVAQPKSGIDALVVQQAYASLKLPADIVLDAGKFVTNAGAEVIEAKDNWLYSRSILFGFAIPFTHTGLRATVPIPQVEGLSFMAGLFNGWDNPPGDVGSSKVGMGALIYSGPSNTVGVVNFLYGKRDPSKPDERTLVDVVLGRAFGDLSLNVNFDYGHESGQSLWGIAGMARYSLCGDKLRIAARGEYMNDDDGLATGVVNKYYEGTLGVAVPVGSQLEFRVEGRHDRMDTAAFATGKNHQTTVQVAALAWF
jgi:hypothetical protein